jgi:hypothetical protein
MVTTMKFALAAMFSVLLLSAPLAQAQDQAETDAIRHLMMQTFDKPETPLTVEPVTVSGDIAVAGWAQGDRGGRALLRKNRGNWALVLCSGDALKEAKSLRQFGLDGAQSEAMAAEIINAEAKLDPALVEKFATFDGVVMMDGEGTHSHSGSATAKP